MFATNSDVILDSSQPVLDDVLSILQSNPNIRRVRIEGHTSDAYWNMVGPFGGITAATALNAVLQHPALLGQPVALTVNYAAALAKGRYGQSVDGPQLPEAGPRGLSSLPMFTAASNWMSRSRYASWFASR